MRFHPPSPLSRPSAWHCEKVQPPASATRCARCKAAIGNALVGSGQCCCSLVPSFAALVHWSTVVAAIALVGASSFAFIIVGKFSGAISDSDGMSDVAAETALGAISVNCLIFLIGALSIAEECKVATCRTYFGFLSNRFGRGLALLFCGLIVASYSRVLVRSFEQSGHTPPGSSYVELACGASAVCAGLLNVVCALACCKCLREADEEANTATRTDHDHKTPQKVGRRAAAFGAGGGPPEVVSASMTLDTPLADPELGVAGGECKTPRSGPLSVTKGRKGSGGFAATPLAAPTPDCKKLSSAASDNPFVGRVVIGLGAGSAANPKAVDRC